MMIVVDIPDAMVKGMMRLLEEKDLGYEDLSDMVADAIRNYSHYEERVLGRQVA
jgi:metal-responsive CopG/Arc/MetJ family transcriptional regulator